MNHSLSKHNRLRGSPSKGDCHAQEHIHLGNIHSGVGFRTHLEQCRWKPRPEHEIAVIFRDAIVTFTSYHPLTATRRNCNKWKAAD